MLCFSKLSWVTTNQESNFQNFRIADAMVQLECISLVKTVLNSKTGLEFFLERDDYIDQFAHGWSFV